jgi:transposase
VRHVGQDTGTAYAKGVALALPNAQISFDRYHVVAMANEAMDKVRQAELRDEPQAVAKALGTSERKTIKGLMWGLRKNPSGWSHTQRNAMHWLQHSGPKSARAWRLTMALREVCARAAASNDPHSEKADLNAWLSWALRCRRTPSGS